MRIEAKEGFSVMARGQTHWNYITCLIWSPCRHQTHFTLSENSSPTSNCDTAKALKDMLNQGKQLSLQVHSLPPPLPRPPPRKWHAYYHAVGYEVCNLSGIYKNGLQIQKRRGDPEQHSGTWQTLKTERGANPEILRSVDESCLRLGIKPSTKKRAIAFWKSNYWYASLHSQKFNDVPESN